MFSIAVYSVFQLLWTCVILVQPLKQLLTLVALVGNTISFLILVTPWNKLLKSVIANSSITISTGWGIIFKIPLNPAPASLVEVSVILLRITLVKPVQPVNTFSKLVILLKSRLLKFTSVSNIQFLKVLSILVTLLGIVDTEVNDVQPWNVPFILVTLLGILGTEVNNEQSLNVLFISVTPLGIVGIVVNEVQLWNAPLILLQLLISQVSSPTISVNDVQL